MIKIKLSKQQKAELENYRKHASSRNSEKALMVLLKARGRKIETIAKDLDRNEHTVRLWLNRYIESGIKGLKHKKAPGRPKGKRLNCIDLINEFINISPCEFGYAESVWNVPLMYHLLNGKKGMDISEDTIERALKDMGYTFKRPAKSVSPNAPSREEKLKAIHKIIEGIKSIADKEDCEILALDETHFSTEPYLIKGWFKKNTAVQDSSVELPGGLHSVWMLKSEDKTFLLEEYQKV